MQSTDLARIRCDSSPIAAVALWRACGILPAMPRLTPFERITMAVEAQIPLVRARVAALGTETAHRLVREALDNSNRAMVAKRGRDLYIPTLKAEFAGFGEGVRYEFTTIEDSETTLR